MTAAWAMSHWETRLIVTSSFSSHTNLTHFPFSKVCHGYKQYSLSKYNIYTYVTGLFSIGRNCTKRLTGTLVTVGHFRSSVCYKVLSHNSLPEVEKVQNVKENQISFALLNTADIIGLCTVRLQHCSHSSQFDVLTVHLRRWVHWAMRLETERAVLFERLPLRTAGRERRRDCLCRLADRGFSTKCNYLQHMTDDTATWSLLGASPLQATNLIVSILIIIIT